MPEIRPARDEADLVAAMELNNELRPDYAFTLDDLRSYMSAAPQEHFLAFEDGTLVGFAHAALEPGRDPFMDGLVRPERRRQGAGSALLATVFAWLAERDRTHVGAWVRDRDEDGRAFLEHRGFEPVKRELEVSLELRSYEPEPIGAPEGITIASWAERPDASRGLYEVACEANPDIPGDEQDEIEPYEDWLAHDMQGSGDRPEATFVAFAGDEVVGYSKLHLTDAQPTTGYHDLTGVKRAWRGRGIAGALKRAQIAWAKEAGYERLVTGNEERNEPIRRLNERLGYEPYGGRTLMRGPVRR